MRYLHYRLIFTFLFSVGLLFAAAETEHPTAIEAQSGYTDCTIGEIDEDITGDTGGDSLWCDTGDANNVTTTVRVSFPTPSGDPVTTTDAQTVRVYARKTSQSTAPSCTFDIYENGTSRVAAALTLSGISSATYGSNTWTYTGFTNADGSGLEVLATCTPGGGNPNNRASGEVGAIQLELDVTVAGGARKRIVLIANKIEYLNGD